MLLYQYIIILKSLLKCLGSCHSGGEKFPRGVRDVSNDNSKPKLVPTPIGCSPFTQRFYQQTRPHSLRRLCNQSSCTPCAAGRVPAPPQRRGDTYQNGNPSLAASRADRPLRRLLPSLCWGKSGPLWSRPEYTDLCEGSGFIQSRWKGCAGTPLRHSQKGFRWRTVLQKPGRRLEIPQEDDTHSEAPRGPSHLQR